MYEYNPNLCTNSWQIRREILQRFKTNNNQRELIIGNPFFKLLPRKLYTWKLLGDKTPNQIDYILTKVDEYIKSIKPYTSAYEVQTQIANLLLNCLNDAETDWTSVKEVSINIQEEEVGRTLNRKNKKVDKWRNTWFYGYIYYGWF